MEIHTPYDNCKERELDSPVQPTPPTLRSRPSVNTLERGTSGSFSRNLDEGLPRNPSFSSWSDTSSECSTTSPAPRSPLWENRFGTQQASPLDMLFHRRWWSRGVLYFLIFSTLLSWYPVARHLWRLHSGSRGRGNVGNDVGSESSDSVGIGSQGSSDGMPHVLIFHESRCAGESIQLWRSSDLCALRFSSGVEAKDNVASLLVVDASANPLAPSTPSPFAIDVYATCRLAEHPADPMLMETISTSGCVELSYPLQGHLALRIGGGGAPSGEGASSRGGMHPSPEAEADAYIDASEL